MQKLTIQDYNIIKEYLKDANYHGYNSNFVNMMMWDHEYNIYYHQNQNYIVMLHDYRQELFFSMPFCKKEYIIDAINYMIDYAHLHQFTFKMSQCTDDIIEEVREYCGDSFFYLEDINNYDYVYSRESLVTLSGKKMQKRRNHLNSFMKENIPYVYKEIESEDLKNIYEFLNKWDQQHGDSDSVKSEYTAIEYILNHKSILPVKTGCIYIHNQLEAFTIASPLNHQTIEIHIEKANKDIRGLYVLIAKEFLEHNFTDYLYVNREEDMGLPSLRRSKQNLHPIEMIKKYCVIESNIRIIPAKDYMQKNIEDLWLQSFEDEDQLSTRYYFDYLYLPQYTYVMINNDTLIGSMQIRPDQFILNQNINDVYFIEGVCIDQLYRHHGFMKMMMNHVLNLSQFKDKKLCLQAYIPQIYESFGFHQTHFSNEYEIPYDVTIQESTLQSIEYTNDDLLALYQQMMTSRTGYRYRSSEYYQLYQERTKAFHSTIEVLEDDNEKVGYVEYQLLDNAILVYEIIYKDRQSLHQIIHYLMYRYKKDIHLHLFETLDDIAIKQRKNMLMTNFSLDDDNLLLFFNEFY